MAIQAKITLTLTLDDDTPDPSQWDFSELFDLAPNENVDRVEVHYFRKEED